MALINKIREKSGVAVGVIAVGLLVFIVGGDLMGPKSGQKDERNVGEIAGNTIPLDVYQKQIEDLKYNFTNSYGRFPTETEMNSIRQQAWDLMVVKESFKQEYDAVGVNVSDEELVDMVQGKNISPQIRASFTDPKTGQFDKGAIVQFLSRLGQMPAQQRTQWNAFEASLIPARKRIKFDHLLQGANYITDAEAQQQYRAENEVAEAKYLYIPYYSVSDSAVAVSDSELSSYLNDHQKQYQTDAYRSLEYVTFPIVPSAADSADFFKDMQAFKAEMATVPSVEEDSIYASANTDSKAPSFGTYTVDQLPIILQSNEKILKKGDILGPYNDGGFYTLYKISDVATDGAKSARASHILIRAEDSTPAAKAKAKKKAEGILRAIKRGASFEKEARENSADPSASRGGDLGWFSEGRMVKPFEDAVFSMKKSGVYAKVVETQFGFHIIKVTEAPIAKSFKVATVQREMIASDETRDKIFRQADSFTASAGDLNEFQAAAKEKGYRIQTAPTVNANDRRLGAIADARTVVSWAFRDAAMEEVSDAKEAGDNYIVAALTGVVEKGTAPLSTVKAEITDKVKKEKQAEVIMKKLKGGSLDEMATAYGSDAKVYEASDLKISSNILPSVGFAPEAVGTIFGLKNGEISKPVKTDNGILVVQTIAKTEAPEIADYSKFKKELEAKLDNRVSFNISESLKEAANVKDQRYLYY
ncbi:peptidylprolyl isomerase [Persicobacter psychrovividus]|uniref:Periplasmic chaperone PpiD n=1 Tax=Persicobacter psychrovividus TaxID=387638 RepID=A0ABN6L4M5_9BACT|nr:peptidylprolyl isomerase [Persicobacter psychrovividus]